MTRFDFILGKQFQETLERDYAELLACREAKAWKSVQVLSGSIIEAVLIDYLVGTSGANRPSRDPLKMDLAQAIEVCTTEKVLTERSSQLCAVIRSYRNLIHAGRSIRLAEEPPSEGSATIAVSLVDLILQDVAKARQHEYGLTADQIISKIERDANCLPILRHLVQEMRESERERLMLETLPDRYRKLALDPFPTDEDEATISRLKRAYATIRMMASPALRQKAFLGYVKILREGNGELVDLYDDAFFDGSDLAHATESQSRMVKEHMLAKLRPVASRRGLEQFQGVEQYLTPREVVTWIDAIVRALISDQHSTDFKDWIVEYSSRASLFSSKEFDEAVVGRLDDWLHHWEEGEGVDDSAAELVGKIKAAFIPPSLPEDDDLPF